MDWQWYTGGPRRRCGEAPPPYRELMDRTRERLPPRLPGTFRHFVYIQFWPQSGKIHLLDRCDVVRAMQARRTSQKAKRLHPRNHQRQRDCCRQDPPRPRRGKGEGEMRNTGGTRPPGQGTPPHPGGHRGGERTGHADHPDASHSGKKSGEFHLLFLTEFHRRKKRNGSIHRIRRGGEVWWRILSFYTVSFASSKTGSCAELLRRRACRVGPHWDGLLRNVEIRRCELRGFLEDSVWRLMQPHRVRHLTFMPVFLSLQEVHPCHVRRWLLQTPYPLFIATARFMPPYDLLQLVRW